MVGIVISSTMKAILVVLLICAVAVLARRAPHEVRFQAWMQKYNKEYVTQTEYQTRLNNFISSTQRVAAQNAESKALNSTAFFVLNKFSDLSPEEFGVRLGMKGYVPQQLAGVPVVPPSIAAPPNSADWRSTGITAVKDQGQCGSCWAFSCTESIESVYIIKGGKGKSQVPLAPQQIVDCDRNDAGCNGGDLPTCYKYVETQKGLEPESSYPYRARDGTCAAKPALEQDPITGFKYVIPQGSTDEATVASFVAANTPVSIIVDASSWSSYGGGILMASQCGHNLDHAVQAVGFEISAGYWIVRNSWGADWGENGYIRLQYNKNTCGMDSEITIPTI